MRLIDADAAAAVIEEKQKALCPQGCWGRGGVDNSARDAYDEWQEMIDKIYEITPVDVAPVGYAHWEKSDDPSEKFRCSDCGGAAWYYDCEREVARSKFCPSCGKRMIDVFPEER